MTQQSILKVKVNINLSTQNSQAINLALIIFTATFT